eukprot:scaffold2576_cov19-Tisochrysis_lutea.AAC.1
MARVVLNTSCLMALLGSLVPQSTTQRAGAAGHTILHRISYISKAARTLRSTHALMHMLCNRWVLGAAASPWDLGRAAGGRRCARIPVNNAQWLHAHHMLSMSCFRAIIQSVPLTEPCVIEAWGSSME